MPPARAAAQSSAPCLSSRYTDVIEGRASQAKASFSRSTQKDAAGRSLGSAEADALLLPTGQSEMPNETGGIVNLDKSPQLRRSMGPLGDPAVVVLLNGDMLTNYLLNTYMYLHRLVSLSALTREAALGSRWQWTQRLTTSRRANSKCLPLNA